MTKTLDRDRKYGLVYGHESYKFCQDGVYFDGQGNAQTEFEAAQLETEDTLPQVVENRSDNSAQIAKLNKMSTPALRKLSEKLSKALDIEMPESGKGAKARYVRFLVDNTTN